MNFLYILAFVGLAGAQFGTHESCRKVDWIDIGIYFAYSNGPIFQNLLPDTEENRQLDSVCLTYFPAVDNPDMYLGYESRVYCDGSNTIMSFMVMQISFGVQRIATPFYTLTDHTFAFDGSDTYFMYRCSNWRDDFEPFVYGTTFNYQTVSLSYLRTIKDIVEAQGLPEQDFYLVPMRLPHKCVTEPTFVPPPNPFFNKLPELDFPPAEPFLEELSVIPVDLPEPLQNSIPRIPLPAPEIFGNEIPVLPFPHTEPIIEEFPRRPFPLTEPVFDEHRLIPVSEPFFNEFPGIHPPPTGLLTNEIPTKRHPLPEPFLNDIPGFPSHLPPPGPLVNDLNHPFLNKNPGLGSPPKPFFNSLHGRSRPLPHP